MCADSGSNAAAMKSYHQLSEKMANLIVENKRLLAAAEGAEQMMNKAQEQGEEATMVAETLQVEMDSELSLASYNLKKMEEEYAGQRSSMEMQMKETQIKLDGILEQERGDKELLQQMLEEVANNLDQVNSECRDWKFRANNAEAALQRAHTLEMSELGMVAPPQQQLAPPALFQGNQRLHLSCSEIM